MQRATADNDMKLSLKCRVPYKTILLKLVGRNAVYLIDIRIAPGGAERNEK